MDSASPVRMRPPTASNIIKKVVGSIVTFFLILNGVTETSENAAKWKRWLMDLWYLPGIDWTSFFSGDSGRWTLLILGLGVGLWSWEVPQRVGRRYGYSFGRESYPPVDVFEHTKSNRELFNGVRDLFEKAGYKLLIGRTDLSQHSEGVWLRGGTATEREQAKWGLLKVGVADVKTDYSGDKPKNLQVIVGAYEPARSKTVAAEKKPELVLRTYEGAEAGIRATNTGGVGKVRVYGCLITVSEPYSQKEFVYAVSDKLRNGANLSVDLAKCSGGEVWIPNHLGGVQGQWHLSQYKRFEAIVTARLVHVTETEEELAFKVVKLVIEKGQLRVEKIEDAKIKHG